MSLDDAANRLLVLQDVAETWHQHGSGDCRDLPAFLGVKMGVIDAPQSAILGFCSEFQGRGMISINAFIQGSPLEEYVIAHEVSHLVVGICDEGEACGRGTSHFCEALAWCGSAYFLQPVTDNEPERMLLERPRTALDAPARLLRLSLAAGLNEIPYDLQLNMTEMARLMEDSAHLMARTLRRDAIRKNPLTSGSTSAYTVLTN